MALVWTTDQIWPSNIGSEKRVPRDWGKSEYEKTQNWPLRAGSRSLLEFPYIRKGSSDWRSTFFIRNSILLHAWNSIFTCERFFSFCNQYPIICPTLPSASPVLHSALLCSALLWPALPCPALLCPVLPNILPCFCPALRSAFRLDPPFSFIYHALPLLWSALYLGMIWPALSSHLPSDLLRCVVFLSSFPFLASSTCSILSCLRRTI